MDGKPKTEYLAELYHESQNKMISLQAVRINEIELSIELIVNSSLSREEIILELKEVLAKGRRYHG